MAIRLTYKVETNIPVEIQGFTPDWVCNKSRQEIERFEIHHGNHKLPIAELFKIDGDATDKCLDFYGDLSGVHWIGANMSSGTIRIHGPAGRHIGSQMCGGEIIVNGDAGGWVGAEMRQGLIRIHGNAGHLTGAAYRGSPKGMAGGTILVSGNAGNEIGLTMRRGLIVVGGSAGDMVGFNMIAGTIVVMGDCGIRPGAGMRRGTIALLGSNPPQLLPSFRYSSTYRPQSFRILMKIIRDHGFDLDSSLDLSEIAMYRGDLVSIGRGEILFRRLTNEQ